MASRGFGLARHTLSQYVHTFWDMSKKTLVEMSRYPVAFVALFVQIFLIILMFLFAALTFSSPGAGAAQGRHVAAVMVYGFVINMFLTLTLWEVGFSIREEQFRGTLESLYLSPASKFGNLVSRIFAVLMWTAIMSVFAVLLVASMVGGLPQENVLAALAVLGMTISGLLGLGFLFAAVTIRIKESAQFLVGFLQIFFIIFSAMFFPFGALPPVVVDYVSRWLPVSYSVDAFRSLLMGLPPGFPELLPLESEVAIVAIFGLLSPPLSYLVYKRVERRARIDGTLGEY
jgi:ABC-2 type transport system permease protein